MHFLYIMWLYAFQFFSFTCKISVVAFSLLYSHFLFAKFCLFVFCATFAAMHWQFVSICSCFVFDLCLAAVHGREGWKRMHRKVLPIRGLFLSLIASYKASPVCYPCDKHDFHNWVLDFLPVNNLAHRMAEILTNVCLRALV